MVTAKPKRRQGDPAKRAKSPGLKKLFPDGRIPAYTEQFEAVMLHPELSDGDRALFWWLVKLSKKEGYCWASVARLAEWTRKRERAVRYQLASLEEQGFIKREAQDGKTSRITINVESLYAADDDAEPLQPIAALPLQSISEPLQLISEGTATNCSPTPAIDFREPLQPVAAKEQLREEQRIEEQRTEECVCDDTQDFESVDFVESFDLSRWRPSEQTRQTITGEWVARGLADRLSVDDEAARFRDHYRGKAKTFASADAADASFRNWCRDPVTLKRADDRSKPQPAERRVSAPSRESWGGLPPSKYAPQPVTEEELADIPF